jgi:hypothetical protein
MSTFVLVHGAWQSTRTWDLLAPLLRKHGQRVITQSSAGLVQIKADCLLTLRYGNT